jgi:predicted enzyme related to lactoylglutathione lyase
MATQPRFAFALEYVDDVNAAKDFYTRVLGLAVDREAPNFVQFRDPSGANFAVASDEAMDGARDDELYWVVDDADAAFRELSKKGDVAMPVKQMPFGKVFGMKDPAGRPRYLIEFAAERPSKPA